MLSAAKTEAGDERPGQQREEHETPGVLPPARRSGERTDHRGDPHGDEDADRKRPRLAEDELAQRSHHAAASVDAGRPRPAPASARTAPCDSSSQNPSTSRSPPSPRGQSAPRPSAQKNVPNVVSTSPTTYLSCVSGRRRSGRCRKNPSPRTSATAAAPPATVGASPPGRAARTVTMRITSTPSSSTPLNDTTNPGQSKPPATGGGASESAPRSATNSA